MAPHTHTPRHQQDTSDKRLTRWGVKADQISTSMIIIIIMIVFKLTCYRQRLHPLPPDHLERVPHPPPPDHLEGVPHPLPPAPIPLL